LAADDGPVQLSLSGARVFGEMWRVLAAGGRRRSGTAGPLASSGQALWRVRPGPAEARDGICGQRVFRAVLSEDLEEGWRRPA
jgi:hypothetical protein